MSNDEKVQVVLRLLESEREELKQRASDADKSMNQYILDSIFDSDDDNTNDSKRDNSDSEKDKFDSEFLLKQIEIKDTQIKDLQRLLDQQQQLSLADKKEKEQLKLALQADDEKPKKFWQRIFK